MARFSVVALKYYEKYYQNTEHCLNTLKEQSIPVYYAERDGVGNMSRAFNEAFKSVNTDYVWFVTNVTWTKRVPFWLMNDLINNPKAGATHPTHESDHQHLRFNQLSPGVREVPFLEFTAPMFRSDIFRQFMLDEDHWYYYMDLIISKQMREAGYKILCSNNVGVHHVYLRNNFKEPITKIREKLRKLREEPEHAILMEKYGPNWRNELWQYF